MSLNNLSGETPSSLCYIKSLSVLDLGRNNLKGAIPPCLGNMSSLMNLDMRQNNLYGDVPNIFCAGRFLGSLNLRGNKLVGKILRSLADCEYLQFVDLGDNLLNDAFPMWLGTLQDLKVLSLRSNNLYGSIPIAMKEGVFPQLRIFDLSYNTFTGNVTKSLFQDMKVLMTIDTTKAPEYLRDLIGLGYDYSTTVAVKGLDRELVKILSVYTVIDLSSNRFEGLIPSIMGELIALRVLNLSHNGFQGHIPSSLGKLSAVGLLDLSSNKLSGEIPTQFSSFTSLEFLNVSHNHLTGCIPRGHQFNTFGNSSYEGTDGLRGFPVSKGCGYDGATEKNHTSSVMEEENKFQFLREFGKAVFFWLWEWANYRILHCIYYAFISKIQLTFLDR